MKAPIKALKLLVKGLEAKGAIVSCLGRIEMPVQGNVLRQTKTLEQIETQNAVYLERWIARLGMKVSQGEIGVTKTVVISKDNVEVCRLVKSRRGLWFKPTENWETQIVLKPFEIKLKTRKQMLNETNGYMH